MQGVFVDWISLKQRHAHGGFPVISDGLLVATDGNMTEIKFESLQHAMLEGSHSTKLRIRCDGSEVTLSGNVGRFGRPDNLFGYDLEATIKKANRILANLGIPPFTRGVRLTNDHCSDYDAKRGLFEQWTGATVSNIHLTRNYITGSPENAQRVIDWLDSQSVGHIKKSRSGNTSVTHGSKRGRKLLKFYLKAPEMLAHAKRKIDQHNILQSPVYQWAHSKGLVRAEFEAHRLLLRDKGLRYLGDLDMGKLIKLFEDETEILNRVKADESIIHITALPTNVRLTAAAYLRGDNLHEMLPQSTWYRHAKILRQYGIDIAIPRKVGQFPISIRVIDIQPAVVPDWYWQESRYVESRKAA